LLALGRKIESPLAINHPRLGVNEMKNSKKKTRHEHDSKDDLYENRDKALERVFTLCEKYEGSDEQAEELDKALDVLAVAQIMLTLDFASGCLSS
jgi:SPX domain protein involved in polyphosphate accumulation